MEVCVDSVEAALNAEKGGKFLVIWQTCMSADLS